MAEQLLRRPEVEAMVAMSTAAIYKAMRRGDFPEPVRITATAVRWRQSEIQAWLEDGHGRPARRRPESVTFNINHDGRTPLEK